MTLEPFQARMRDFEVWLLTEKMRSDRTAAMRVDVVQRALRHLGQIDPSVERFNTYKAELLLAKRTPRYVTNIVFAMRDYFEFRGRIEEVDLLTYPKDKRRRAPKYLTVEEVRAFLAVVGKKRNRAMYFLLAYTGVRVHELVKVRPEELNLEARTLRVMGKGSVEGIVNVGEGAIEPLRRWLEVRDAELKSEGKTSPWLFYITQGPNAYNDHVDEDVFRKMTNRYAEKAQIGHSVNPHQFRHALATNMVDNGSPLPVVQKQLRHADIKTTMIYVHLSNESQRKNFDRFTPQYG